MKKVLKKLLADGHPHLDVAERYNMPLQLVWAIDMEGRTDKERMARLSINVQPYDVWGFAKCHDLFGSQHPGRIPGELIAHVLYFYTQPGAKVIDPMVGSGTTLDTCPTTPARVELPKEDQNDPLFQTHHPRPRGVTSIQVIILTT